MDALDRMIGDPLQYLAQVVLGIEAVELCGFGECVDGGGPGPAGIGTGEQPVLAPQYERADGAFGGVVVEAGAAVAQHEGERLPARERVADGGGEFAAPGDAALGGFEPGSQFNEQRRAADLPGGEAGLWWPAADVGLDRVEQ